MSPFTVLVLCIQACLIQSVMSQCGCGSGYRGLSYNAPSYNYVPAVSSVPCASPCNNYGGSGPGMVSAAGTVGANGDTQVVGSVPVLGDVSFSGPAQACGSVSLSGQCGCGCS